jgi:dTDP-4-dehydrorhamnose 3,5-epimerase
MGKFNFIETKVKDVYIIEPTVFGDNRGFFMETYHYEEFSKAGLDMIFVQDNHSKSKKSVLRGLHFQKKHPQGKLVKVIKGAVYDVAVDLRKDSTTFGKWVGVELTEDNKKMFYVPEGFAHGFVTLEDDTEFLYKCTDYYHLEDEGGLIWNDPSLNISWPIDNPILSEKDTKWLTLEELDFFFDYNNLKKMEV